jgi:hypothetical protein
MLETDPKPLNADLGDRIETTDVFYDDQGNPAYYIVYLNPSGFIIVSADDLVESVVGFVVDTAFYDPSPVNPLGALVHPDLSHRTAAAKKLQQEFDAKIKKKDLTEQEAALQDAAVKTKDKWHKLAAYADSGTVMGVPGISDVRVAPLMLTKWGQDYVCGDYCYNYYMPNHWYCGCVATAMACFPATMK